MRPGLTQILPPAAPSPFEFETPALPTAAHGLFEFETPAVK